MVAAKEYMFIEGVEEYVLIESCLDSSLDFDFDHVEHEHINKVSMLVMYRLNCGLVLVIW